MYTCIVVVVHAEQARAAALVPGHPEVFLRFRGLRGGFEGLEGLEGFEGFEGLEGFRGSTLPEFLPPLHRSPTEPPKRGAS